MIYVKRIMNIGLLILVLIIGMLIGLLGVGAAIFAACPLILFWWMLYDDVIHTHGNKRKVVKEVQDTRRGI